MKRPAGKSIAWCVGGVLLGIFGMAVADPNPSDVHNDQPLIGYVKPATVIQYRDKPVYIVPDSCKGLTEAVEVYETSMLKYSNALGQVQGLAGDIRVTILAKDAVTLKKQIEQFDAATGKIYAGDDHAPVAELYQSRQSLELQMKRCIHDITNQTN